MSLAASIGLDNYLRIAKVSDGTAFAVKKLSAQPRAMVEITGHANTKILLGFNNKKIYIYDVVMDIFLPIYDKKRKNIF